MWHLGSMSRPPPPSRKFFKYNTRKRRFQRFWNPGISFRKVISKIFHKNGQLVGAGGVEVATTEFWVLYHCEFIFCWFSKKQKVTEVVVFVSFNFSILQGQYQRLNHHYLSHSNLPCFLLAVGEKSPLFSSFLQQMNSVRPTSVVSFAGRFLFRLGRTRVITHFNFI